MTIGITKAHLLRTTLLAALAVPGMAIPAFAQETTGPAAQPAAETEERDVVVVTGSRIARQDYVANSPIVTVDQEDILSSGVTTVDTLLNTMPQFVPGINMTSNNPPGAGQANLQLRGLGSTRTLVLMNGRRVVPTGAVGSVDTNVLPSPLIGNVETITGGASATYGSDAIAGVVNFILRDDFEGVEFSTQFGQTDRGDGATQAVSLAAGGDFADGAGHAMLMMSYNNREDIYNVAREFSAISGTSGASPLGNTIFDSNNLPTQAAINAIFPQPAGADCILPGIDTACLAPNDTFGFNNNGTLFDYRNRTDFISPGGILFDGFAQPGPQFNPNFAFNTGALNLLTLPQTRYNAFAAANYEINRHFDVYGEFLFTNYESNSELAASPAAGSTTGFRVPVSNPFISAELAGVLASRPVNFFCLAGTADCGAAGTATTSTTNPALVGTAVAGTGPLGSFLLDKRFVALGPRIASEIYDVFQFTAGVRGEIGFGDWTYDLYGSYGRVNRTTIQNGNVSRSAVQQLLNATDGGASLCAGGFDWFGETTLSSACQTFIARTSKNFSTNDQRNVEFSMQGGAFELPAGEIRAALGVSYREDNFNFLPDGSLTAPVTTQPCLATVAFSGAGPNLPQSACTGTGTPGLTGSDIAGFNPSAALAGATDVIEGFAEVLVPVLKDLPLVQEFNVTLAGRTSDYSTVGSLQTWKADMDWTVVDSVRIRGGYQKAVRAPSIGELFAPVLLAFPAIGAPTNLQGAPLFSGDPCDIRSKYRSTAGTDLAAPTNAQVRALCITQGVSSGSIDTYTFTNQQVPGFGGGNPNLEEETATSYSVGVVWNPEFENPWLANLTASVDYYNIELENAIGTVSATNMVQQCYNANGVSNPTYDPNNVFCQLFTRNPLNGNINSASANNQNLAAAKTSGVDFQVDWSMDLGPGTLDAGIVGAWLEVFEQQLLAGNPYQDLTGTIANTGALGAAVGGSFPEWKWMFSSNYRMGPYRVGMRWQHIGEMTNLNAATDNIPAIGYFDLLGSWDVSDNLTLRVNVNNVLDEQPPVYSPAVQANTDPSNYDVLGRRYTIGLTARF